MSFNLIKLTWMLRIFGWTKIPIIGFLSPKIRALGLERTEIVIPLSWRSKNHLGAMYFGALATGADIACGLLAFKIIREQFPQISLVFKDISGEFLKRAEGDVHFVCEDGPAINKMLEEAERTGERCHLPTTIVATVPSIDPDPVARFQLTLSVKKKAKKLK